MHYYLIMKRRAPPSEKEAKKRLRALEKQRVAEAKKLEKQQKAEAQKLEKQWKAKAKKLDKWQANQNKRNETKYLYMQSKRNMISKIKTTVSNTIQWCEVMNNMINSMDNSWINAKNLALGAAYGQRAIQLPSVTLVFII